MSHQSSLGLLRLHQRDADIDTRERFAADVASRIGPDLVVLSTCHRVECYVAIPPEVDELAWMRDRVLGADGDRVPVVEETGLRETADLVATRAGLAADRWSWAYQSAGHTAEEWLRPDLKELFPALAAAGHRGVPRTGAIPGRSSRSALRP